MHCKNGLVNDNYLCTHALCLNDASRTYLGSVCRPETRSRDQTCFLRAILSANSSNILDHLGQVDIVSWGRPEADWGPSKL